MRPISFVNTSDMPGEGDLHGTRSRIHGIKAAIIPQACQKEACAQGATYNDEGAAWMSDVRCQAKRRTQCKFSFSEGS